MSQMAWDVCATVFLGHAFQGVSPVSGHAGDTYGPIVGGCPRRSDDTEGHKESL